MTGMSSVTNTRIGALSKDKAELLKLLLEKEARQTQKIKPSPRAHHAGRVRLPTSWAQQRLWFIDELEGGCAAYHIPVALRLRGLLDPLALKRALDALVRRHEILRTVFVSSEGTPWQEIMREGDFPLREIDLRGIPEVEREGQVRAQKIEEVHAKFDLRAGPLVRGRLLRLQDEEHVLLITMHHIVSDGWSIGIMIRELAALYRAHKEGGDPQLSVLPIQYADYAQWQRQWLQGEALERQLGYWREHLGGAPPQLELPTDRPRPAVQSYRGGSIDVVLDSKLSATLRSFAQRQEITLFMLLQAAWSLLLARLSGQDDVVSGTPIANRQRPELEGLIGFFVNTLALRVQVQGEMRVGEFLTHVKTVTLGAYDHQDVPFEQVVETLQPERSLSRNPLFQVMFALLNAPKSELQLPAMNVSLEGGLNQSSMFDLHLLLEEDGEEISGAVNYAADLFDHETVQRWMASFQVLLQALTDDVNARIGDLPVLPEQERLQIIEQFNATQAPYPQDKLIQELFEEQVARTPDATALVFERNSLSYAELNAKANQLARFLREKDVGPDELVGICVERSLEMVIGLLGILKAGGAYVPIDPGYPPERLVYMLNDSAPKVLLTQEKLLALLPETTAQIVALDRDWSAIAQRAAENLGALGQHSEHLAYMIYTSGSTGRPKGAMNEHRGLVNRLHWMQNQYQMTEADRVLQKTPFSFDVSVWEFFWTLLNGARLVVARPEGHKDPAYLQQLIEEEGVTRLHFVPSMLQSFLDQYPAGRCPSLRHVVCSGEELPAALARKFYALLPQAQLSNLYGPTEAAIDVTAWECKPDDPQARIPIGRPIANIQMYVLDARYQPVPIGVSGEIYIGGVGVGRGYLNRPELTAERFIKDPFSRDPKARLYRTGDVGRWRADGAIEYLGRNDHQVKIRGYRIELGEIESQIIAHPQVKEAVVIAQNDTPDDKRLIAYVVGDRNAATKAASSDEPEQLRSEIVNEWETIFGETYSANNEAGGPSFVGWNSSYTGEPIPEAQMQEWLQCTLDRIQALRPQNVLEIGCGVGLLVQHLAPRCARYVGTDFSASALAQLRQWISGREELKHVELLQRSATELQDFEAGSFDTLILNSVVQYFPDIEYLLAVLQDAARLLAPGGKIFLGDIRHLGLLPVFHSAVQLSKAAATVSVGQLRRRVARAVAQEKELVIDPQLFEVLPGRLPGIAAAEVQLKRGSAPNELTRYRYDVILHTGPKIDEPAHRPSMRAGTVESTEVLEAQLKAQGPTALHFGPVKSARLAKEAAAQKLIETSDERLEAGALRRQLNELSFEAVDPEWMWQLAEAHGYDVRVRWSADSQSGDFVADFQARDRAEGKVLSMSAPADAKPWGAYANDPLENSFRQSLIPLLREYLKGRLPEYMVPSAWMAVKQLPLTPNGKVDRRALPLPQSRPEEMGEYLAPRTELERTLAELWAQVLRVDQVGVQDNFFELGGHSLLGVKLIARLAERFAVTLSVAALFQYPTIEALAKVVESLQLVHGEPAQSDATEFEEGVF
jgi:amino acid adenylation domain-containing protein